MTSSRQMKDFKHIAIVVMVGLALIAQLMIPTPVRADGGTPPPPDAPVETAATDAAKGATWAGTPEPTDAVRNIQYPTATEPAPSTAEPEETPLPPTQTPEATAAEQTEPAAATPEPVETAAPEQPGSTMLGKALQWLPDDTSVVVLDEYGQPLPLASQAAADAIAQADPMWCPQGVIPGGPGCTPNFFSMQQLLIVAGAYINSQNVNGTIWITAGSVPDVSAITIDGLSFPNWANYSLSLQGGWSGFFGDSSIIANSVFSVPITIANWNNTVGIANITTGNLTINNPNGVVILADVTTNNTDINNPRGRIDIYNSTGNLTINSADINNNGLYSSGININTLNGNVTINSSSFYGNGYDGVWMQNVGTVSINNSQFYQNANTGLEIYNANNVFVDGAIFTENLNGLVVYSAGTITLNNSSVDGNPGTGASLNSSGNLSITDSTFNGSSWGGLTADSAGGSITLNSITVNNTYWGYGAYLTAAGDITLTGTNVFDNNAFGGLNANSGGNITAQNVTATNSVDGAGAYLNSAGSLTLTGTNVFNGNGHNGLNASSGGDIAMNNVTADSNGISGISIASPGNVTLNGVAANSNGGGMFGGGTGVFVSQANNVNITNGVFNNNLGDGVHVENTAGDIQLGAITANGNSIYASGNGSITLDGVTVSGASGFGLGLQTFAGNITINNSAVIGTVADGNNPLFPWGDGADIYPNGGDVTITNSQFIGNAFDGAFIVGGQNILVEDSAFNENGVGGLDVFGLNQIDIRQTEFTRNSPNYDLLANCGSNILSLIFDDSIPTADPNLPALVDILVDNACNYSNHFLRVILPNAPPVVVNDPPVTFGTSGIAKKRIVAGSGNAIISESRIELFVCFDQKQRSHRVNLPNGDKVEIVCPVSGKASISRLDNTTLPRELPAGYTFASAFQVEISQRVRGGRNDERALIDVITEGGFIKASFVAPPIQSGATYSILYWDKDLGDWIPLKDFLRGTNGFAQIFRLRPAEPEDPPKLVLRGVEFVQWTDPQRVEVTTNFPGIFVLVQQ